MTLNSPAFLLLLLALPLLVWLGWPSRGPSRRREIISLGLRLAIALLLIAALAGLGLRQRADDLSVVFLVDDSDSMSIPVSVQTASGPALITPRQLAHAYVREALRHMGPTDRAGVILFGADALVERPLSPLADLASFTTQVTTLQTDLAEAIRLGLALLPADTARRLVILSDGLETTGDAFEAARLAAASGAQILVVPFSVTGGLEVMISDVRAPARLREGEQFGLEVVVDSARQERVGVRVLAGDAVAYEGVLDLNQGVNRFTLPLTAGAPGFAAYRVQIIPPEGADAFYQNNELAAFSLVEGPPTILLVTPPADERRPDASALLISALTASNLVVESVAPGGLPSELSVLAQYASLVLVDVPATQLSQRQMLAVQTYVRDLGGGLLVVGGPTSYGVGGYYQTPIEESLPVDMNVRDPKRFPAVSFVVVMDKSGSMSATEGGVTKMRLADEGAARVAELMHDFDEITIIAFDTAPVDVIGPIPGTDREEAARRARTIGPGGGGILVHDALAYASAISRESTKPTRHIILLADGSDSEQQEGVREMVEDLAAEGITLSVVAIGQGQDVPFLQAIAALGNGRFHQTTSAAEIPNILTSEAVQVQRAYIVEQDFFPQQVNSSPILSGIEAVPSLLGYVATSPKDAARMVLISRLPEGYEDPILATWQYGLGKSVAWTSDATGRWANNWVSWDHYTRFWAQAVGYTLSTSGRSNHDVRVSYGDRAGEQATITVDALSDQGAYLNGLDVRANVVGPDGQTITVELAQSAPGRYSGTFNPTLEGAYLIRVAGADPDQPPEAEAALAQTAGWVLSYSPEYRTLAGDPNFLVRLAGQTGGQTVGSDYASIFRHDLTAPARASRPLWPVLLSLAAFLLPLDIAVRRLVVTRYELQRAWRRVRDGLALRRPEPAAAGPRRTEQLSSLFKAKDRAGASTAPEAREREDARVPPIVTRPAAGAGPGEDAAGEAKAPERRPPASAAPSAPAAGSTSAALLARKRAREAREKKE